MANFVSTIDAFGIHKPQFADCLAYFVNGLQAIAGADVVLTPDTQDGQAAGIWAAALDDCNSASVACYNSFSPQTAQGVALDSVVKVNGIARAVASFSTVQLTVVGQAFAVINGGVAQDQLGNYWALPASVTIPAAGVIVVTGTCQAIGAVNAPAGAISSISTPSYGWQSVTNALAAIPGNPVEVDGQLRQRQTVSTMIRAQGILEGLVGQILALPGVTLINAVANATGAVDVNGIPPNSLAVVVNGGVASSIAGLLYNRLPGIGLVGTTVQAFVDRSGISRNVAFSYATIVPITWQVSISAGKGFTADVQAMIVAAIVAFTGGLRIGQGIKRTACYGAANLFNGAFSNTFEITNLLVARGAAFPASLDVAIAYNEICGAPVINVVFV